MDSLQAFRQTPGYVVARPCVGGCGGFVVIYDRDRGADWMEAPERWIVMHEPSSNRVCVATRAEAYAVMESTACGDDDVDLLPLDDGLTGG